VGGRYDPKEMQTSIVRSGLEKPMTRRAIIIGAGIAGLSAAIALREVGWDIALYEQAPALEPLGAALSLWPNAMAALTHLGCDDVIRAEAQPLCQIALVERDGRMIANAGVAALPGAQAYLPTRTQLQMALLSGLGTIVPQLDHRLLSFAQDQQGVSVHFENGHQDRGDLLIAADGIWSSIAQDVIGDAPHHAGYGGVLALSDPVPGYPSTGNGREHWGVRERFGLFDLKADRKYWFYMRNEADPAESRALTKTQIAERMADWPDDLQAAVAATQADRLIPFSIHAKPPPRRLGQGRIICVGDAAHAMEPNMGQGGCQSLEDAVALGAVARAAETDAILPAFERLRLKRVRQVVQLSKQAGIIPHHLPPFLSRISRSAMRFAYPMVATRSMRQLYSMPHYD
jgi:2-polyprenyl-6-methoxyphenol hydroxylase-like FAD-dependent oxidoreductase